MTLGFSSADRLERLLLKTRSILGEGDDTFRDNNKAQSLQKAASYYSLYDGDGSETTYTDSSSLTILQSDMIATKAAIDLLKSAISYYKDDVIQANGGPASATFRSDKLNWLKTQLSELKEDLADLESANGYSIAEDGVPGLAMHKVRACSDPVDDVCCDEDLEAGEYTVS